MDITILLFDRFTALDAVGPYEVFSRLPEARVTFAAEQAGPVATDCGRLRLVAEATLADLPRPDIVVVPGGPGQAAQMADGPVHEWLRSAIQLGIEYDPQPPYNAGSPGTAPAAITAALRARTRSILTGQA